MSLSKEKQVALLRFGVIAVLVLFALWFFLVHSAQTRLGEKLFAADDLDKKLSAKKELVQQAPQIQEQLKESSKELRDIESQMVTGDIYLWIQKTLRDFEIPDQIEFTKYDPPQLIEPDPPLKVPYKVASFAVNGIATYHDLGTFLSNFENSYPHIRIRRLEMEPASVGSVPAKDEKLNFFMELQALVRPGNASGSKSRL